MPRTSNKSTVQPTVPVAETSNGFTPTFVKYKSMTEREQAIFRQGATTANNSVKEKLGLKKPRD